MIAIKGMQIPEFCFNCHFAASAADDRLFQKYTHFCNAVTLITEEDYKSHITPDDGLRPSWCPLVEAKDETEVH